MPELTFVVCYEGDESVGISGGCEKITINFHDFEPEVIEEDVVRTLKEAIEQIHPDAVYVDTLREYEIDQLTMYIDSMEFGIDTLEETDPDSPHLEEMRRNLRRYRRLLRQIRKEDDYDYKGVIE